MEEIKVKGIILSAAPHGEYGRRLQILTDQLGRITAFAGGAAKAKSHIIGAARPMTSAEFLLRKGRSAWNLHSVQVMDSFESLSLDPDAYPYSAYVLETGMYFSEEGMPALEAKQLLNLMFVTLSALRDKTLPPESVRRIYELRLLKLQGEYTEAPAYGGADAAALWKNALTLPLTKLYGMDVRQPEALSDALPEGFSDSVEALLTRQVSHRFRSLAILQEMNL